MFSSYNLKWSLLWTSPGQTDEHRKFMMYFADKGGFCFVSCYCIVVDDVNKLVPMEMPCPLEKNVH